MKVVTMMLARSWPGDDMPDHGDKGGGRRMYKSKKGETQNTEPR